MFPGVSWLKCALKLKRLCHNGDFGVNLSRRGRRIFTEEKEEDFHDFIVKTDAGASHEAAIHCFTRRPILLERKDMAGWENIRGAVCNTRPRNSNTRAVIIYCVSRLARCAHLNLLLVVVGDTVCGCSSLQFHITFCIQVQRRIAR